MRKLLFIVLTLMMSVTAYAGDEDIMITRDGSFINVKVLKINATDIRFINLDKRRLGELNAPTDFVYMIMKEKGNNIVFDEEGNQMTSPVVKLDKKDNVLFLNNGKYFPIFNLSINKDNLTYKLKDSKKAPVYQVSKDEVFLVKNEDGTTTLFNNKYIEKLKKAKEEAQRRANTAPTAPSNVSVSTTLAPNTAPSTPAVAPAVAVPQASTSAELKFLPATGLADNDIINLVYSKQPYTLYGKGTVAEYVFMKGAKQVQFMGGPTYMQQIVAEEKVSNGVLSVQVSQAFFNKKHEPSKGIPASFKSLYFPTEIDTAGTYHLTHDISRDVYSITSRRGYALLLPASFQVGEKIKCSVITDEGKNLLGGKVSIKAEYFNFQVDGTEQVTTPAGTFDCIRLKGNVTEKSSATNKYNYTWWLARGVGFVKYEIKNDGARGNEEPLVILLNKLQRP